MCLMLVFNNNAKFMNDVRGYSHRLFPSQARLVFLVYFSYCLSKPKVMHEPMRTLQDFEFYRVKYPRLKLQIG